jgi:hypothetical protein
MNLKSELQDALARAIESPKVAASASAFSTASGVAALQQWVTGAASTLAVFAGLVGVLVLARLNWIKGENERIRGRILREKAAELGIDLLEDKG